MKSLLPSCIVAVVTLLGVWLMQHPVSVPTFAAAPSPSIFLYLAAILAAAPFVGDFAKAWWSRSKGTVNAAHSLLKATSQRAGGLASWKMAAIAFVAGVAVTVAVSGGLPSFDWSKLLPNVPSIVPTTKGERFAIIVRESEEDDTQFSGLIGELHAAEYLKAKGHTLIVFDDDDQDKDGKPVPLLDQLKPFLKRELIIVDKATKKVLSRGECPMSTADVVTALQKAGG